MSHLFWLSEYQMDRLRPLFPKSHGRPRVDDLRVLGGIIHIIRNGLRWCDALVSMVLTRHYTTVLCGGLRRVSLNKSLRLWRSRQGLVVRR
jgi:transposase